MARELIERSVSFNYDYSMHCSCCGGTTIVSAQNYLAISDSHIDCSSCGSDIHYGPAVAAIRNPADDSLVDHNVAQLAWYHTSTTENWPLSQREPLEYGQFTHLVSAEVRRQHRERHADDALHVGTYEAAIESMLRRMRDQRDAHNQFLLYRVALIPALTIEPSYRDENHAEAAKITQSQIHDADALAIRYLNVHEAQGSISLAVCREAIDSVQVVRIPLSDLRVSVGDDLVLSLEAAQARLKQLAEEPRSAPRTALERLQAKMAIRRPDSMRGQYTDEQLDLIIGARDRIAESLLGGISPVVRESVKLAMSKWENLLQDPTLDTVVNGWAGMAALLRQPGAVIERLSRQASRTLV